ncbi:GTP cyclohydrolase FolE2 [Jatrophihabitans telluris]|uniref:GTP cyclohydrolase FolE2 n=1 Tax=Jatrophihabitans telluris TaxID=2038343 RepID=A0ABY4QWE2_9ACTN|nr:GTP cyclohydrolase FolE2 [Jatrophihabitans telluris]UQX87643.1 GTP cyclohydrolase FolE2 [Jatrophihabitans telluris]
MTLEDVQNRPDSRGIAIDAVGVNGLRYPISVLDQALAKQDTIGEISMSVALPAEVKGTHLSRFLEILTEHCGELTQRTIPTVLTEMQDRLGTTDAQLTVAFPYFLPRSAPVSGATALMDYACRFRARLSAVVSEFALQVAVPVTSVCPCSKAISDYGAHNQRGLITIEVWPRQADGEFDLIWIEDLISIAEASASSPVYPILKRTDERHVTMAGYDKPVFVEDMVREAARELEADDRIAAFTVEAVNDESIHNHGAFARIHHPATARASETA